ncbi:MAG: polymorphic toxin-type HINT domain-containing protein [Pirellulales bacterium]
MMSRKGLASLVLVTIVTIGPILSASDPATTEKALKLVAQAVQAEIDGDLLSREKFLSEAKQTEANFAPANWLRGQVFGADGAWITVDQAIEQAKSDKLLASYEAMRAEQPPTIQGNLQAAVWCAKNKLPLQCRAHIENVLNFDADHQLARKLLGHVQVGHEWLTPDEQCRIMLRAAEHRQGFIRFEKQIKLIYKSLDSSAVKVREAATDQLDKIDDPLAIPVVESLIDNNQRTCGILIDWLGRMDCQAASLALTRICLSSDGELRSLAIAQLKKKPLHDFVPELVRALTSPVSVFTTPVFNAQGEFSGFRQVFSRETVDSVKTLVSDSQVNYVTGLIPTSPDALERQLPASPKAIDDLFRANPNSQSIHLYDPNVPMGQRNVYITKQAGAPSLQDVLGSEKQAEFDAQLAIAAMEQAMLMDMPRQLAIAKQQVAVKENELTIQKNRIISELISDITACEFVDVPGDVWKWWDRVNETSYGEAKSMRRRYENNYVSVPRYQAMPTLGLQYGYTIQKMSCFVAGTEVQTSRGLRKIETILPGDLVLSKDISTGELSFKPVIAPTTRKPAKTVILKVDDDTIHATTSHLLWVCGKGWTKAGEIKAGDLLHSAAEPAVVISSTPGAELPTHNLIVADTHTYFVGASRILSHDVLPRGAVHELIPGQFMLTNNR